MKIDVTYEVNFSMEQMNLIHGFICADSSLASVREFYSRYGQHLGKRILDALADGVSAHEIKSRFAFFDFETVTYSDELKQAVATFMLGDGSSGTDDLVTHFYNQYGSVYGGRILDALQAGLDPQIIHFYGVPQNTYSAPIG